MSLRRLPPGSRRRMSESECADKTGGSLKKLKLSIKVIGNRSKEIRNNQGCCPNEQAMSYSNLAYLFYSVVGTYSKLNDVL